MLRNCLLLFIAFAVPIAQPSLAHGQQPSSPPANAGIAEDANADALLKQYRSANDPREAQRAFEELKLAAAKSPRAAYVCGVLAAQKGSVVADKAVALRCLTDAARADIPDAQYRLAIAILESAPDDPARQAEAERWLARSAAALPESVYLLAKLEAARQPNPELARRNVVEKAALAGYAPAQHELARRLHGEGNESARAASRDWLEKAVAQGNAESIVELALQLAAEKREQDVARVVSLLEQASKAGSPRADYALGLRLLEANGVKRDTGRAFSLIQRAAAAGDAEAQYALGFMIGQGAGVSTDDQAALGWLLRAAENGHLEAMFAVGNYYANGWGVGKSMDIAYDWYCKAAQRGHQTARTFVKRARGPSACELAPVDGPADRGPGVTGPHPVTR
jgi:uncharacterized protein